MWYVIWTSTGSEKKALAGISDDPQAKRAFIPRRAVQIKRNGEWVKVEKPLFPGYLFVDTDEVESLADEVRRIEGFNKILTVNKEFCPLYDRDADLIESLYGNGGLFDVSEGMIEGDRIIVTSGPLKGQEGLIKKIDRHKRLAYLESDMFGQTICAAVGLEIVEKH
jgi:transcriptional antiterminator NusG